MVRDCRKDFGFKISGYGVNLADDALAGMRGFWSWMSGSQERYALLLY